MNICCFLPSISPVEDNIYGLGLDIPSSSFFLNSVHVYLRKPLFNIGQEMELITGITLAHRLSEWAQDWFDSLGQVSKLLWKYPEHSLS